MVLKRWFSNHYNRTTIWFALILLGFKNSDEGCSVHTMSEESYTFSGHREALYRLLEATVRDEEDPPPDVERDDRPRYPSPFLWYNEIRPSDIDAYHASNNRGSNPRLRDNESTPTVDEEEEGRGSQETQPTHIPVMPGMPSHVLLTPPENKSDYPEWGSSEGDDSPQKKDTPEPAPAMEHARRPSSVSTRRRPSVLSDEVLEQFTVGARGLVGSTLGPAFKCVPTLEALPTGWSGGQDGAVALLERHRSQAHSTIPGGYADRALRLACHVLRQPTVVVKEGQGEVVGIAGFAWEILRANGEGKI